MTIEVQQLKNLERSSAHSHITGLGVDASNKLYNEGLVGQIKARLALNLIKKLIEGKRRGVKDGNGGTDQPAAGRTDQPAAGRTDQPAAGRTDQPAAGKACSAGPVILLSGKRGTGKTALAYGLSRSLGPDTLFHSILASDLFNKTKSITETMRVAVRSSIGMKFKEMCELIEGEVIQIKIDLETKKSKIFLKTTDMESVYEIGEKMINILNQLKIVPGDVISINKKTGSLKKVGKTSTFKYEYSAFDPNDKFVPCPEGELCRMRIEEVYVSLNDMDVINGNDYGCLNLFGEGSKEIEDGVRDAVDQNVNTWVDQGKAEMVRGVLFIDEIHLIADNLLNYLNKTIEEANCPTIVLATNRLMDKIDPAFKFPKDLVDRVLLIETVDFTENEIADVLKLKIRCENLNIQDEDTQAIIKELSGIAFINGIRYAMNLLSLSSVRALKLGRTVCLNDIKRVGELFTHI